MVYNRYIYMVNGVLKQLNYNKGISHCIDHNNPRALTQGGMAPYTDPVTVAMALG